MAITFINNYPLEDIVCLAGPVRTTKA